MFGQLFASLVLGWSAVLKMLENMGEHCARRWPPAVESSIAVEDAVDNRGLYRVFGSRLF